MKTLILFAILLFSSLTGICMAQGTDPCAGKKYNYWVMDPVTCKDKVICAENPNSIPAPNVAVRWPINSQIKYSTGDLTQGDGTHPSCVDQTALDKCIDDAFCAWASICPSWNLSTTRYASDPGNTDIIPIGNVSNAGAFGTTNQQQIGTIAKAQKYCFCNGNIVPFAGGYRQSTIRINTSSVYKAVNTDVYPCPSSDPNCQKKKNPVDLCTTMAHEIGHIFGMEHTIPGPSEGLTYCGSSSPSDLLNWEQIPGLGVCDGNPPHLTADDQCMFRKLYCYGSTDPLTPTTVTKGGKPLDLGCFSSGVDNGSITPSFDPDLKVFPNPSSGILNVEFSSHIPGTVILGIYDLLGNQMLTNVFREQPGRDSQTIDISSLPSGHYIVRVSGIDLRGSKTIKLIK